ncbi:S-adenosylmethionine decarboxylase [Hydrogenispora ethanolica]|uniref:S-adenosylmethionine decarboxylase n=1 Tax=Hydrogenispora ethanolica TaxID=1082276 RepID=A0A4R1SB99_HYDET|nr:S-adenosylmethionine decarboxylase [Hydrogenispora ethanolica]TCL76761.1 S-adenosylmethionine decarboxylase [Hydrogenispora ethanolica]
MYHFVMDAFRGYRSRLDDMLLVYEALEEIPQKLGMKTVMPPMILPYYNGVVPEDCGISAFVFLAGGHFTIHTFSFRETYFVDLLSPEPFDAVELERLLRNAFPAEKVSTYQLERGRKESYPSPIEIHEALDFGPHVFLDIQEYNGPRSMDDLFQLFDTMPFQIGMTPIIRPYMVKNRAGSEQVTSVLTMIAESHISLHYFAESKRAYFDLFSCRFFNYDEVLGKLKQVLNSPIGNEVLISRGSKYQQYKNDAAAPAVDTRAWLANVYRR